MNDTDNRNPTGGRKRVITRILLAIKIVVSFGLIAVLLSRIDLDLIVARFSSLRWGWLALALVILQAQSAISTLKWRIILRTDGEEHGFLFLWKTYLIGNFLSLFLPTSFGGDIYRVWAVRNTGAKMSKSTASVLFDRITGVFALATIGIIGGIVIFEGAGIAAIIAGWVVGVVVLVIVTSDSVVARLPEPRSKVTGFPFRILRSFNLYRRSPGSLSAALALSGLFQFNVVLIVFCYARALQISADDVSFVQLLATVPVIYLTEMLPISINGIGVRDSAFVFFFKQMGSTAEKGLALSLLIVAVRYINGLGGGLLLLMSVLRHHKSGKLAHPAPQESPPG